MDFPKKLRWQIRLMVAESLALFFFFLDGNDKFQKFFRSYQGNCRTPPTLDKVALISTSFSWTLINKKDQILNIL